jgi:hypothetical protein
MSTVYEIVSTIESIDATHGSKAQPDENAWVLVERFA